MAQFLLSVWHDADYVLDFSSDDAQRRVAQVEAFNHDLVAADALVHAGGLHPAATAVVVRPDGDDVAISDGPYADTDAQMGGFWIIETSDESTARGWARQAALACEGPVEVRPLQG